MATGKEVDEEDEEKTAFTARRGLEQFIRFQFCLKNVLPTLQVVMNVSLLIFKCQFVFLYLDDLSVFSKTAKNHVKHTRSVFLYIKDGGSKLR